MFSLRDNCFAQLFSVAIGFRFVDFEWSELINLDFIHVENCNFVRKKKTLVLCVILCDDEIENFSWGFGCFHLTGLFVPLRFC